MKVLLALLFFLLLFLGSLPEGMGDAEEDADDEGGGTRGRRAGR